MFVPAPNALTSVYFVYQPPTNTAGDPVASFTFQVKDNGGTANGGLDRDPTPNTIAIAVTPVNDPPSFAAGPAQNVLDTGGPQSIGGWASQILPGPPNEVGQKIHFKVSTDNAGLFAVQPVVDPSGKLTFQPASGASGVASVTVVAIDDGGTANNGVDSSQPQTFTISVSLAQPLHNRVIAADVTGDGNVVAEDAIDVLNFIYAHGSGPVAAVQGEPHAVLLYDVTGDDYIAADDVMTIINYINAHPGQKEPSQLAPTGANSQDAADDGLLMLLAGDVASQSNRRGV